MFTCFFKRGLKKTCDICMEDRYEKDFICCVDCSKHTWCNSCDNNMPLKKIATNTFKKQCPFCRADIFYVEEEHIYYSDIGIITSYSITRRIIE